MEAKIKSGTFLAESCGRVSNPPPPKSTTFFDAAPNVCVPVCVSHMVLAFFWCRRLLSDACEQGRIFV